MGKCNPIYKDYTLLKNALLHKLPNLTLITTEAELNLALSGRVLSPSMIKITMENADGKQVTSAASDFMKRNNQNFTSGDRTE